MQIVIAASAQNSDFFFQAAGTPANPKVQAQWDKYYTYSGIRDLCSRLAKKNLESGLNRKGLANK